MAKSSKKRHLTPETPTDTTQLNVECKVIRLCGQQTDRTGEGKHVVDLLQALKAESESLLSLMESHQGKSSLENMG